MPATIFLVSHANSCVPPRQVMVYCYRWSCQCCVTPLGKVPRELSGFNIPQASQSSNLIVGTALLMQVYGQVYSGVWNDVGGSIKDYYEAHMEMAKEDGAAFDPLYYRGTVYQVR